MSILHDLMLNETPDGAARALAAYQDQLDEIDKKLPLLIKELKEHSVDTQKHPSLKAYGQLIRVNQLLDQAFKALHTI